MSNIIKLLPDSVANQIAAGEVIQRPASAVKELLENAVDAGATKVTLIIKDAGKTLIQVTDNGTGMSDMDARMCLERHATSKISKADDLFAINTMGFRGEAIASIAAIAHMEIKSCTRDEEIGTQLIVEGSEVKSQEPCQCPVGTSILVKNLFFNVPARRNFLKSNTVELRHILEEFTRVALVNNDISFVYYSNDKLVFSLSPASLKARIAGIFGSSYDKKLLSVEQETEVLKITGFIGKPEYAKKTRGEQYFFVNNRYIRHAYLNHAVNNAYSELIPEDSYPTYFINISIDPKEIDINIHPTKTEVNFQDARYVYAILQAAVKQSIGKHSLTPQIDFNVIPDIEIALQTKPDGPIKQPEIEVDPSYNPFKREKSDIKQGFNIPPKPSTENWEALFSEQKNRDEETEQQPVAESLHDESKAFEVINFLQVHNRFITCNVSKGLLVIDQQKAHERILYEDVLKRLKGKPQPSQQQLFPQNINLSPGDADIMTSLLGNLKKLGFVIEELNQTNFVIVGIPVDVGESDSVAIIEKIIENHKKHVTDLNYDRNISLAKSMAVKLSIKTGTKLEDEEMQEIYDSLFKCDVPAVAPDGKKVFTVIKLDELTGMIERTNS